MESLIEYVTPPNPCGYLAEQMARFQNLLAAEMSAAEYESYMVQGWRRFGRLIFRPRCEACSACQSLRIGVKEFRPDRSQRRNWAANQGVVQLSVQEPKVTEEKLDLYDRYHSFQAGHRNWSEHPRQDREGYERAFIDNPFPAEEWQYRIDGKLIGIGYFDRLPTSLSAIYFFYDPEERSRGLGTWNVLSGIDRALTLGLKFLYLGYFVDGSQSLQYKSNFRPNELLLEDGGWHPYRA